MDARERWQALQARLTAARAALEAGERDIALTEITAALELDRDFLAAHALRDRILAMGSVEAEAAPAAPTRPAADPYAKFEQRARRRRVDRRVDAARAAMAQQRVKAAAAALDEVIDLDPNLPELAELTAQFDQLRRSAATPHRGPWIAAGAVFAAALLGGSWIEDATPILSRQIVSAAPLPAPVAPLATLTTMIDRLAVGTTGTREHSATPSAADASVRMPAAPAGLSPAALRPIALPIDTPATAPEAAPAASAAAVMPGLAATLPKLEAADESALVKQVLQRYRTAYEGLDAQSARAVWPAVDEAALARAFDGLASQTLTFDACDVRLHGDTAAATATCRGSARYVPKVGSRDPRVEPRVWNFTLHKADGDWKIDAARAER